jgi:hypothetical protein
MSRGKRIKKDGHQVSPSTVEQVRTPITNDELVTKAREMSRLVALSLNQEGTQFR